MATRTFMKSRPGRIKSTPLKRGNSIPVVAISNRGNKHLYSSITAFVNDVEGVDVSQRRTANRRVTSGGGYVGTWYVRDARG